MVRILAWSQNNTHDESKRAWYGAEVYKKVRLGIYCTQMQQKLRPYQVSVVISQDIRIVDKASD